MKTIPPIVVQIVHIEGPKKGEIQEFSEEIITLGRDPSCHVQFPKDLVVVSRMHAKIVREGNRFQLIDQSSNGSFVNGKRIEEAYLKDGDVLTIAEGGPKVSFLTEMRDAEVLPPPPPTAKHSNIPSERPFKSARVEKEPRSSLQPEFPEPPPSRELSPQQPRYESYAPAQQPKHSTPGDEGIQRVQTPLIIQYGPTLRTFNELPVTVGRDPQCDFIMDHPDIQDHHAQFFFTQDQYWVKDLTGKRMILINGQPLDIQGTLKPDNRLSLSSSGPNFRFLGDGRLAEIDAPPVNDPFPEEPKNESGKKGPQSPKGIKGAKSILNKFLKR